jgi:arginine exporter protein ArgO
MKGKSLPLQAVRTPPGGAVISSPLRHRFATVFRISNMEIFLYLIAMVGGSIQYDSEWYLSLLTVCVGIALLVTYGLVRLRSSFKNPKN